MLTEEVKIAINVAAMEARNRRHEIIGLEHLLLALVIDPQTRRTLSRCGGDVRALRRAVESHLTEEVEARSGDAPVEPEPSLAFRRVLTRAASSAASSSRMTVSGPHVIVAMFSEEDSHARWFLEQAGVTRLGLVQEISHGGARSDELPARRSPGGGPMERATSGPEDAAHPDRDDDEEDATDGDALSQWTTNLNEAARAGRIDRLVGRHDEIERTVRVLARRRKNNPLYVGDSGVGKTAIAEGLARRIVEGEVPTVVRDMTIYSLDLAGMIAGARYRGDFEQRLKGVLKALEAIPGAVLFIDEIHTVIGAGSVSGGSMDASNMLKPALASGRLRCIGSTTYQEYRSHFEKDRALARRFQKIDVLEPSLDECHAILEGLREVYETYHGVRYTPDAIRKAVDLSARLIPDRKLPDKAIDLLDEAGANRKIDAGRGTDGDRTSEVPVVDGADIETLVAKIARIPAREVTVSDRERLATLESDLRGAVFGQEEAIGQVVAAVKLARAGLNPPERPLGSFLFTGPTGVGKTEVARQLARTLGVELVRFDMSEYMEPHSVSRLIGAPPGYIGFDQGGLLTEAITKNPHCVLLLDEIEKAHTSIYNVLLQVMDHGTLTDNNGRRADFRNVVLIMTSNVGARDLDTVPIGFGFGGAAPPAREDDREFHRVFSPEFRNRLDARVRFSSLDPAVMGRIVDKFMTELAAQLVERGVTIRLSDAGRDWLARKGYDPRMGARPLARVIKENVKRPLSDEILFGALEHGGSATVDATDDGIVLRCTPGASTSGGTSEEGGGAALQQLGDPPEGDPEAASQAPRA